MLLLFVSFFFFNAAALIYGRDFSQPSLTRWLIYGALNYLPHSVSGSFSSRLSQTLGQSVVSEKNNGRVEWDMLRDKCRDCLHIGSSRECICVGLPAFDWFQRQTKRKPITRRLGTAVWRQAHLYSYGFRRFGQHLVSKPNKGSRCPTCSHLWLSYKRGTPVWFPFDQRYTCCRFWQRATG